MSLSCQTATEVAVKMPRPLKDPAMAVSLSSASLLTFIPHVITRRTDVKDIFVCERACESESNSERKNKREDTSRDNALMISANVSAGPLGS